MEKPNEMEKSNEMEKPNEIEKPKIGAEAELSLLEKVIYFAIYLYFFAMAVYQVYIFPQGKQTLTLTYQLHCNKCSTRFSHL